MVITNPWKKKFTQLLLNIDLEGGDRKLLLSRVANNNIHKLTKCSINLYCHCLLDFYTNYYKLFTRLLSLQGRGV